MSAERFFTYRPERIFWCGFPLLSVLIGCVAALVGLPQTDEPPRWSELKRAKEANKEAVCLHVALSQAAGEVWRCPIPDLQRQVAFSLDPSRPDEMNQKMQVSIRLKDSSVSQRFEVPCRIPLLYRNGVLTFGAKGSSFCLELFWDREVLLGRVLVDERPGEPFRVLSEESPIQTAQEFSEDSPFRQLALGRWWGPDLFYQTYIEEVLKHRIDLGSPLEARLIDVKEGRWLAFLEGEWKEISHVAEAQKGCIARVLSSNPSGLLIEGWEENRHIRLCLPEAATMFSKIKAEELFGSIRVRSDKQISCLLDKQCLIIKVNDWVVKTSDRWKILRKAEEKEAFLKGKLVGELFVLDQISNKQGQKSILGHMYNLARTQMTAVDVPVLGRKPSSAHQQNSSELKGKMR
jgi:hypothetical protein